MTARTHDLAAITALGLVVLINPLSDLTLGTAIAAIFANQIGGIAPDVDQPTAPIWRNLPSGGFFGRFVDKLLGGHRFLSHSLLGVALFGFAARWVLQFLHPLIPHINIGYVWWAFIVGMLSHLCMDSLTKEGVPWLLPIPIKFGIPPLRRLRITTGKRVESLLVFPALVAFNIWLCATNYEALVSFMHQHLAR